jgi:hypothetical protein
MQNQKGKTKRILFNKIDCECDAKYTGETGRPLDIRVSEHRRIWLKFNRNREEGDEAATSSLLASHSVEHNHQLSWEEVTKTKSSTPGKKNHETAVMHIE